jgi:uncharacterized membrane protein
MDNINKIINNNTKADLWVRSWTKSFTWRIVGIVILILLSYLITGSWVEASLITFVFHAIRLILYVLHERAWELTAWGRATNPGINMFWFYFWLVLLIIAFAAIGVMGCL